MKEFNMTEIIQEGENVLLCLDKKRSYLVKIEKGKNFHTHKGFLALDELIGKEYGARVKSSSDIEFFVFKPCIQDYIFKASRRTQILYPKDIALIIVLSSIHSGSRVVEAGTGSGALTMALAYYVKPLGRVYTYEVRREFIEIASKNLEKSGLSDYVEIKNKDISEGIDEKDVDAVVLDMATPWLVIPHAYQALKGSGILISFSPTIDQVVKTVESLRDNHFAIVETIECLVRRIQTERGKTRPETLMTGHTGYITSARKTL
jgi:tRNA (adenine57-N1/adenine58-N1)-methyltransferase